MRKRTCSLNNSLSAGAESGVVCLRLQKLSDQFWTAFFSVPIVHAKCRVGADSHMSASLVKL